MFEESEKHFRLIESKLDSAIAASLPDLARFGIEYVDWSNRPGYRGDYPFLDLWFSLSRPFQPPERILSTTCLCYYYPLPDQMDFLVKVKTLCEIYQLGCLSRTEEYFSSNIELDELIKIGLAKFISAQIEKSFLEMGLDNPFPAKA